MMKKKREIWPVAIVMVYVVFIVCIVSAGVAMMRQDVDLVAQDYYAQELVYQEQINKEILTRTLEKHIQVLPDFAAGKFTLIYPLDTAAPKPVVGKIHLFRPSDARLDQHFEVAPDALGRQVLELNVAQGLWRIKIDWKEGGLNFYHEEALFLKHAAR